MVKGHFLNKVADIGYCGIVLITGLTFSILGGVGLYYAIKE